MQCMIEMRRIVHGTLKKHFKTRLACFSPDDESFQSIFSIHRHALFRFGDCNRSTCKRDFPCCYHPPLQLQFYATDRMSRWRWECYRHSTLPLCCCHCRASTLLLLLCWKAVFLWDLLWLSRRGSFEGLGEPFLTLKLLHNACQKEPCLGGFDALKYSTGDVSFS